VLFCLKIVILSFTGVVLSIKVVILYSSSSSSSSSYLLPNTGLDSKV
jgi:hypothetical protein